MAESQRLGKIGRLVAMDAPAARVRLALVAAIRLETTVIGALGPAAEVRRMDTMEITKVVGAVCGSLLIFLLIHLASGAIFNTESDVVAFSVPVAEPSGGAAAPAEESVDVGALVAAADVAKGQTIFKKCAACHHVDNTNSVGPHLNGVVGRPVGAVEGFAYSDAVKAHGGNWTPEEIFHFIAAPKKDIPGTKMGFAGLPKPEERADVIAYLETLK